jgi:hypothetical protein
MKKRDNASYRPAAISQPSTSSVVCSIDRSVPPCSDTSASSRATHFDLHLARARVRSWKTGRPVRFELREQTRQAIDDYLKAANKRPAELLFTGRRKPQKS